MKRWFWIHRCTSLLCTLFLLMLCITGLPLIFADEIEQLSANDAAYPVMPANAPLANLDAMTTLARRRYPNEVITFVYIDDDEPQIEVHMLPAYKADQTLDYALHFVFIVGLPCIFPWAWWFIRFWDKKPMLSNRYCCVLNSKIQSPDYLHLPRG